MLTGLSVQVREQDREVCVLFWVIQQADVSGSDGHSDHSYTQDRQRSLCKRADLRLRLCRLGLDPKVRIQSRGKL